MSLRSCKAFRNFAGLTVMTRDEHLIVQFHNFVNYDAIDLKFCHDHLQTSIMNTT